MLKHAKSRIYMGSHATGMTPWCNLRGIGSNLYCSSSWGGKNDKLLLQPIKETVPIKNPIENPQAHPDLWDQLQIPVQVTQNQIQITNPDPPPCQIPVHDHPDRPTHIPKPMRAMQESTEYLRCKENAQACGKNWAHNGDVPLVEDEDDVEDIIAMKASEIMNIVDRKDMWVPDNYEQALTKLNIWMPAMDVEIHCMEEWGRLASCTMQTMDESYWQSVGVW